MGFEAELSSDFSSFYYLFKNRNLRLHKLKIIDPSLMLATYIDEDEEAEVLNTMQQEEIEG